jgi:spore germination cell wall hydrolase CwlJ-like protein
MLFVSDIPVVSEATYKPSLKDQEFFASMKCLSDNAFFEARGTSQLDMQAVTEVVINRTESGKYHKDVCRVIYQKYQFSWANKGYNKTQYRLRKAFRKPSEAREYKQATLAAYGVLSSTENRLMPSEVLWYHSHKVNPVWNKGLVKVQVNNATLHVLNQDKPLVHAFWYQPN